MGFAIFQIPAGHGEAGDARCDHLVANAVGQIGIVLTDRDECSLRGIAVMDIGAIDIVRPHFAIAAFPEQRPFRRDVETGSGENGLAGQRAVDLLDNSIVDARSADLGACRGQGAEIKGLRHAAGAKADAPEAGVRGGRSPIAIQDKPAIAGDEADVGRENLRGIGFRSIAGRICDDLIAAARPVACVATNALILEIFAADDQMASTTGKRRSACQRRDKFMIVVMRCQAILRAGLDAFVSAVQHEVDHACHRVRSISSGRAAGHDIDPLNKGGRYEVGVHAAGDVRGYKAPSIDQRQRAGGAQPSQVQEALAAPCAA